MSRHESSVNYQNLIRDLAEMYPQEVTEVAIIELIANSLDAGATRISLDYDASSKVLVVTDNGKGMDSSQFDQYHDFAAGLKTRGNGIGFAGVGAKISFNVADRVITETRSQEFSGGSNWYLESARELVWEDIQPTHLSGNGTRVEVRFRSDVTATYGSGQELIRLLQRHYLPLLDARFLSLYQRMGLYSSSLRFVVNGQEVVPSDVAKDFVLDKTRQFFPTRAGKRVGLGIIGLAASEYPLGQDICGLLLCTRGKVIKADLFNQFPGSLGPRIFGMVEAPPFVEFLTTAKTDFIRGRGRHREFERLYDPIRQEFKAWLTELGVQPIATGDTDEAAKVERELRKLVEDVPELADFFGFRIRAQVLQRSDNGTSNATIHEGQEATFPIGDGVGGETSGLVDIGDDPGEALVEDQENGSERAKPISRTSRRGPKINFDSRPDRLDLAWVDGNTVIINSGHPSYEKARVNQTARMLHSLFAIATAVQRFTANGANFQDLMFIDRMMGAWGGK